MVSTEKERTSLDEAASGEDQKAYDQFVALYDESLRNLTEGEIVRGKVMSVGESSVIVDVGYKSEGLIPARRVRGRRRQHHRQGGRRGRGAAREDRGCRRPHPALLFEGGADADLDGRREELQGGPDHQGSGHRSDQGRTDRRRRRPRLPAGQPRRHQAGQEPRSAQRQRARVQGHQPRPAAQQHRPVAQGRPREGVREEEGARPSRSSRRACT